MIEKISFLSEIEVTDASVIIKEMNDYNSVIKKKLHHLLGKFVYRYIMY